MARYPDARWRPLGPQTEPRLVKKNKIVMHTMVGTLWGTDHYFRDPNGPGYSGTESHFGTDPDEVLQWQDTTHQADAQLEGNDDCISIETADHGGPYGDWSGSDVPAWTPEHLERNARLVAWLCREHDIPCVLIDDTRDSTRGVGYHRQGIDPYRDEGERYSTSFGKVCPGDRRVAQMPELIARANEILDGDDMTPEDVKTAVAELFDEAARGLRDDRDSTQRGRHFRDDLWAILKDPVLSAVRANRTDPAELAQAITAELGGSADAALVEQAVRRVLGSLDESA